MDEFSKANPVFLRELEKDGRVLFSREPFATRISSPLARRFSIVSYDLSSLSYKEKMRVLYRLYRAGRGGMVGGSGGAKLGSGCVLVPREAGREIVDMARSSGAKATKIDVLLEERGLRGEPTSS